MEETSQFQLKKIGVGDAQKAYCCMTEVPTPWPEALCHCRDWVSENLGKYVDGYHLQSESGVVAGHIYFADSERALFSYEVEPGAVVIYCEWIQLRFQGQGLGRDMFASFLNEIKDKKGVVIETTDIEGQMHYQHYTSRGFKIIHEEGHNKLLHLPLTQEDIRYMRRESVFEPRPKVPVEILIFRGFLCPYEVSTYLQVKDIASEFGDQIFLKEIWISPETLSEYGVSSGVMINGKRKLSGGESESSVRQAIREEL